jgi:hypothetical protein
MKALLFWFSYKKQQRCEIFVELDIWAISEVQRTEILKSVAVRCTFKQPCQLFCYKYYGALHL